MKFYEGKPPVTTRRIYGWNDLPGAVPVSTYLVENEGNEALHVTVGNKRQRVLEGLLRSPMFAASYIRLSDHVDHLKRAGFDIETMMYRDDPDTGRESYGVYVMRSQVTRLDQRPREVAA